MHSPYAAVVSTDYPLTIKEVFAKTWGKGNLLLGPVPYAGEPAPPYDAAAAMPATTTSVFAASLIATTAGWVSLRSTEIA